MNDNNLFEMYHGWRGRLLNFVDFGFLTLQWVVMLAAVNGLYYLITRGGWADLVAAVGFLFYAFIIVQLRGSYSEGLRNYERLEQIAKGNRRKRRRLIHTLARMKRKGRTI